MDNIEITLLSEGQIWGNSNESQLEVMKKNGTAATVTDLCILRGCFIYDDITKSNPPIGRTSFFWTRSDDDSNDVCTVIKDGNRGSSFKWRRSAAVRPVFQSFKIFSQISPNRVRGYRGTEEVEYGEYPQYAVNLKMQSILESEYNDGRLNKTGKSYTFDLVKPNDFDIGFKPVTYKEYEYLGKKYVRIRANFEFYSIKFKLSNGVEYRDGDYVWVEVSPVQWLIDDKSGLLISQMGLVSGIRFLDSNHNYKGDFKTTEMYKYLNEYFAKDIIPSMTKEEKSRDETSIKKQINPYNFKFNNVSEEDIIRGAIESGVSVFLHGPSSEGKSARVKQIDPTCEIIYLRNATPDSLNGKSVYNSSTGEMIDIKPTWLTKVEEKCEKEKDRLHIVFFDEITNALPSIQGISFNIILDREVNGKWKLPDNARVVAAGNDMKDSLAANKLAEPLFNRFAHVYIKTTTESWLKWASENNIHPAIYSYIAYKNGSTLRSEYNGEKPNADPRKWEMASKMLYATGSPEMIRALVGEDITKEFVTFCKSRVITLEDVLNGNYTDNDIESLNTAEKYATVMTLSQVSEDNLETVRDFTSSLGKEYTSVFDTLWSHNEEDKLEKLQEIKLEGRKGNVKCKIRERN